MPAALGGQKWPVPSAFVVGCRARSRERRPWRVPWPIDAARAVGAPPAEGRGRLRGVWRRYRIPQSPAESLQSLSPRGRAKRQTSLVDNWTISHFSKANPEGPGQSDVAALLRSIAQFFSMSSGTWRFRTSSSTANWKTGKIVPR